MIHAIVLMLAMQAAAQDPAQHQNAGVAALKAAQTDVAIAEFKKEIELDPPACPRLFWPWGCVHAEQGLRERPSLR